MGAKIWKCVKYWVMCFDVFPHHFGDGFVQMVLVSIFSTTFHGLFGKKANAFWNLQICVNVHRAYTRALFLKFWHLALSWHCHDFLVIPNFSFRFILGSIWQAVWVCFGLHVWSLAALKSDQHEVTNRCEQLNCNNRFWGFTWFCVRVFCFACLCTVMCLSCVLFCCVVLNCVVLSCSICFVLLLCRVVSIVLYSVYWCPAL